MRRRGEERVERGERMERKEQVKRNEKRGNEKRNEKRTEKKKKKEKRNEGITGEKKLKEKTAGASDRWRGSALAIARVGNVACLFTCRIYLIDIGMGWDEVMEKEAKNGS